MSNTYHHGRLMLIVLKTSENTYIAACEQLCIIRENADREHAVLEMLAATKRYLKNVITNQLGEHLLNQKLPEEFYEMMVRAIITKSIEDMTQKSESLCNVLRRKSKTLQRDLASA